MKPSLLIGLSTLIILLQGCAIHLPASELAMYADATKPEPLGNSAKVSGLAISMSLLEKQRLTDYLNAEFSNASLRYPQINPTLGYYRTWLRHDKDLSMSMTLGLLSNGLDLTYKRWDPLYLTVGIGPAGDEDKLLFPGTYQAILQYRLLRKPTWSSSLGFFYERNFVALNNSSQDSFYIQVGPNDLLPIRSYGLKWSNLIVASNRKDQPAGTYLYPVIHVGYSPDLAGPIFRFTLAMGSRK